MSGIARHGKIQPRRNLEQVLMTPAIIVAISVSTLAAVGIWVYLS